MTKVLKNQKQPPTNNSDDNNNSSSNININKQSQKKNWLKQMLRPPKTTEQDGCKHKYSVVEKLKKKKSL